MKMKMKMNQYKQSASANTLSPHGNVSMTTGPMMEPMTGRPRQRKQSPDNISMNSEDSNMSSQSDVSAITAASTASAFSTQSERRPIRKLR